MYKRSIRNYILEALKDTPVVLLNGARQTGKTTLVKSLLEKEINGKYFTFDEASVLSAAKSDPLGFIEGLTGPVVLDEIQHALELLPAIKASVDRKRKPGRFLLTGSANIMLLPKVSESLAGRVEVVTLWPLSQSEMAGKDTSIVDQLFDEGPDRQKYPAVSRQEVLERIVAGGYPEPNTRKTVARRRAWFDSYITVILQRDVRDFANIERLSAIPNLLSLLASRTSGLLNMSDLSSAARIPNTTLQRYMSLLEATFLFQPLPAWSTNTGLRFIKSPKTMIDDTGLAASLIRADVDRIADDGGLCGALLENFVVMEFKKHASWSKEKAGLLHFRSQGSREVDIVLERANGQVVGVEVKAAASVSAGDLKGLKALQEIAGKRFVRGIVLYTGKEVVPFAKNLHAVPLSMLWS